jgi:hypothetical protein
MALLEKGRPTAVCLAATPVRRDIASRDALARVEIAVTAPSPGQMVTTSLEDDHASE